MPATLHRLRTKRQRLRREQAAALRQMILDFEGLPDHAARAIIGAIDRETAAENGWTFVMLSPAQNRAVIDWLLEHAERRREAIALWALLFEHLDRHTGMILLTRDELAEQVGAHPDNVTRIMADLEAIGAISRRRERVAGMRGPGVARYFMNPNVGTHLVGLVREEAQAKAPPVMPAPSSKPRRPKLIPVE
jgi:Crp-like helix-turn-helix domain